jgi:DNA helicase HerA-like ATPase
MRNPSAICVAGGQGAVKPGAPVPHKSIGAGGEAFYRPRAGKAGRVMADSVYIGGSEDGGQSLLLSRANRHGLVAGATGTGKTVTLQILAQGFSDAGVPVFAADVKGDLSGVAMPGSEAHKAHAKLVTRAQEIGLEGFAYTPAPTVFWDLFGERGHPIRATISEMGPLLLARLLDLNETQEGVLTIAFQLADDEDMLLLDMKDLRALLAYMSDEKDEILRRYGNVSPTSIGAIQRRLLMLEREGGESFFGEPALELTDFMTTDVAGKGTINILAADKLMGSPRLYSTFLLWLLSELFESLPEIGDPEKPKLVFFFDEAHLLFDAAPKALLDKVEQVVRLIRSKGVGVYFVTQNPRDVPESVLAQLGARIQHALRAYTPSERKAVKAAADSFRPNPRFDCETVITELSVGEALVSALDQKGVPSPVARTLVRPPASRLGPISADERRLLMRESPIGRRYDKAVDRRSAYEVLERRMKLAARGDAKTARRDAKPARPAPKRAARRRRSSRQSYGEAAAKSAIRTASSSLMRALIRGILGGLKR